MDIKHIAIIGAGTMGSLVAHALSHRNVSAIYVANRTFDRALELAKELDGVAVRYEEVERYIASSDLVITATSAPHPVLTTEMLRRIMDDRKNNGNDSDNRCGCDLLLIDIATPRDVEDSASELPYVRLYDIDGLKGISEKNMQKRLDEVKRVEKIITEEYELLMLQYKQQRADKLIASLYSQIEELRLRERERAVNRLSAKHTLGDFERGVLDDLTHAITNKVLAEPTKTLRNAAAEDDIDFLVAAAALFKLDAG